jgi:hypothetical protein
MRRGRGLCSLGREERRISQRAGDLLAGGGMGESDKVVFLELLSAHAVG